MRWTSRRFAALTVVAVILKTAMVCSGLAAEQRSDVRALNGRVGAMNSLEFLSVAIAFGDFLIYDRTADSSHELTGATRLG